MDCTRRERFTVYALCFGNFITYMERYCIFSMSKMIFEHFHKNEELKIYLNIVFLIPHTLLAPIYGYYGDRRDRSRIIFVTMVLWAASTLAGAFTTTAGTFFLARAFAGAFHAGYATIGHSVIADIVRDDDLSYAMTYFSMTTPFGVMFGFLLEETLANYDGMWWWNLYYTSGAIFVTAFVILFGERPKRGFKDVAYVSGEDGQILYATSYANDMKRIFKNKTFVLCSIALTTTYFMSSIIARHGSVMLKLGDELIAEREKKEPTANVQTMYITIVLITGMIGVPLGTYWSRLLRTVIPNVDPMICGLGVLFSIPLIVLASLTADLRSWETFYYLFFAITTFSLIWGVCNHVILYTSVAPRRCSVRAWQIVISRSLGDGLAPLFIAGVRYLFLEYYDFESLERRYDMPDLDLRPFYAIRASILNALFIHFLGCVFFVWAAVYVDIDAKRALEETIEILNAQIKAKDDERIREEKEKEEEPYKNLQRKSKL